MSPVMMSVVVVSAWADVLGDYSVVRRVDGTKATSPDLPVVVVASHREFVLGCHDFERFLSPRFRSYLVFSEPFVHMWKLDEKVKAGPTTASLLVTDKLPGEVFSRSLVVRLLQAEGFGDLRYLLYSHCDIHPAAGLDDVVDELASSFDTEKRRRHANDTGVVRGPVYPDFWRINASCAAQTHKQRANQPVFAMNTVLVESARQPFEFDRHRAFHGVDVGGYVALQLPATSLSDVGTWLEDHFVMYDLAMYSKLMNEQVRLEAVADSLFHHEVVQPELLCRQGWTAVRNNGLVLLYSAKLEDDRDFRRRHAPSVDRRDGPAFFSNDAYKRVNVDELRRFQLEILYAMISPRARLREAMATSGLLRVFPFMDWGNNVFAHFGRPSMIPNWGGRTLHSLVGDGLGPLMGIAGYELVEATPFRFEARRTSYPLSRYLFVDTDKCDVIVRPWERVSNDLSVCAPFLELDVQGRRTTVYTSNFRGGGNATDLRLPAHATIVGVGSPLVRYGRRAAPTTSIFDIARAVCDEDLKRSPRYDDGGYSFPSPSAALFRYVAVDRFQGTPPTSLKLLCDITVRRDDTQAPTRRYLESREHAPRALSAGIHEGMCTSYYARHRRRVCCQMVPCLPPHIYDP